jgi:hypothetical protein
MLIAIGGKVLGKSIETKFNNTIANTKIIQVVRSMKTKKID